MDLNFKPNQFVIDKFSGGPHPPPPANTNPCPILLQLLLLLQFISNEMEMSDQTARF